MIYLTLDEWNKKGGQEITETAFYTMERKSRALIPSYVKKHIEANDTIADSVKDLMYELISMNLNEESVSGVTSESNDGVSVSYDATFHSNDSVNERADVMIFNYLQDEKTTDGTPYMYRGVG